MGTGVTTAMNWQNFTSKALPDNTTSNRMDWGTDLYGSMEPTRASASKPLAISLVFFKIIPLVSYCVIFVVGTIGNGLVIYVTGVRMKRTVNSVWFLNLALADFLFTAFLIFQIIYVSKNYHWPFGDAMCKLGVLVGALNMFASVFLLTAISVDRCLATWVVVWAQNKRTPCRAQVACVVIWLAALGCSLPYSISRKAVPYGGGVSCSLSSSAPKVKLAVFRLVFGCLVPFLVIAISYAAIGVRVRRLQRSRKLRSLRIIIAIILAFFFCWFPFHAFQLLEIKISENPSLQSIAIIGIQLSACLGFLNSCLNPILYVFMCDEFHKKLKQSVCHVLESALAEDQLSFVSSRSLSLNLSSRFSRKAAPMERKNTASSTMTDNAASAEEEHALSYCQAEAP
ncbi:chemerin-like receptor 1 [Lampris incognitus]|uniref:chemerin-like receptor 1 n=1 Tax=Lampris incognitus TaxID=2546036 RepID=UPI0024B4E4E0|nr:chemerin-like receptor 1 [Lampris incognitus]